MTKNWTPSSGESETNDPVASKTKKQFGIAALFWMTFLVALALAYLQRQRAPDILTGGAITIAIGLAVGAVFGFATKKMVDAVFWSSLIASFGYISVSSEPMFYELNHRLAWAGIGAVCGAIAATVYHDWKILNPVLCAVGAAIIMLGFWMLTTRPTADLNFDLVGAPVIGIAVSFFLRIVTWLESRNSIPRYFTATWFMVVVIVGNVISAWR
ncbi:MAG: hypothetical protein AB8B55_16720 [Mariniblastus sp.]